MFTIDHRYRGPLGMANGGVTAGLLTRGKTGPVSVRLERPVPYGVPLDVHQRGRKRVLADADGLIATATPTAQPVPAPRFIPPGTILAEPRWRHGFDYYADCFVCARPAPDGLGIQLRRIDIDCFAAVWRPLGCDAIGAGPVPTEFLWAALDCPGCFAALASAGDPGLLGTLAADIRRRPDTSEALVVVGEVTGGEGRKRHAATGIFALDGEVVATGAAVWVTVPGTRNPIPTTVTGGVA